MKGKYRDQEFSRVKKMFVEIL